VELLNANRKYINKSKAAVIPTMPVDFGEANILGVIKALELESSAKKKFTVCGSKPDKKLRATSAFRRILTNFHRRYKSSFAEKTICFDDARTSRRV